MIFKYKNYINVSDGKINIGLNFEDVNNNNYYPLTKINDNEYVEGYWYEDKIFGNKKYPKPQATDIKVDYFFIKKLKKIVNNIKEKYKYDTCIIINGCATSYGFSKCRLCEIDNGSEEFSIGKNGITFKFPEGLIHYYDKHNVQPSNEFYKFINEY
jgi:hypothetical protein